MNKLRYIILACLLLISPLAFANNFIDETKITGDIRLYDFSNTYGGNAPSTNAISLGGGLNLLSGPLFSDDFQLGASFYTAHPIGLDSSNPAHVYTKLPSFTVNTLGQAYLQYHHKNLLLRGGDQLIDTPWLNSEDSFMIPASYEALYSHYGPWQDISFTALREFAFKSRVADHFSSSNLYNPSNLSSSAITGFGNTKDSGTLAFGANLKKDSITSQLWYYQFYNLANLVYGDARYTFQARNDITPYIGIQGLREWGDGNNLLAPYASKANSDGVGVVAGTSIQQAEFSLAYNDIPRNSNAFESGDILSPYTAGYHADPLYTTSMLTGLVETTAGQAIKLDMRYHTENQRWHFKTSYAKYFIEPISTNIQEVDLDGTYACYGKLKGLSLRNRIGVQNGAQTAHHIFNDRVMLQYTF